MIRKFLIPLLAVFGLAFGIWMVVQGNKPQSIAQPVAQPASGDYASFVAGSGLVESASENIGISAIVPGVVTEVFVKIGSDVKKGDPLFKTDDRDLYSELVVKQAALNSAKEKLNKMLAMPRPEEIPPMEAKVAEMEAGLADSRAKLKLYEQLPDKRAVTEDDFNSRRYAVQMAESRLVQMKTDLQLLKAGAWKPDVEISRADVASAEAGVKQTQIELDRRTVRAPIDARVLQVKVRPGEFAPAGVMTQPLMLLGNVDVLHVRVDVDENDAWRIRPDTAATAFVRGNRDLKTALKFVRVEPYVIPKKSLTGESTERVDTRVLQVLYSFDRTALPVYVGQQMDVFIEAPPAGVAVKPAASQAAAK